MELTSSTRTAHVRQETLAAGAENTGGGFMLYRPPQAGRRTAGRGENCIMLFNWEEMLWFNDFFLSQGKKLPVLFTAYYQISSNFLKLFTSIFLFVYFIS